MNIVVATSTSAYVEVTETSGALTLVEAAQAALTVEIATQGPQGPQGPPGTVGSLGEISDVNTTAKIDRSLLYYDAASAQFRADATFTKTTLTDGGNF